MENADLQYIRTQMVDSEKPPRSVQGFSHWLRVNLFASPTDAALTIFAHAGITRSLNLPQGAFGRRIAHGPGLSAGPVNRGICA